LHIGHQGDMVHHKQNVLMISQKTSVEFDCWEDHVADETSLVLHGGSNGVCHRRHGSTAWACSVVAAVAVLDMLKFHLFTIGAAWQSGMAGRHVARHFGRCFRTRRTLIIRIRQLSRRSHYRDHDDRVVPCHSFKFIAALQDSRVIIMVYKIHRGWSEETQVDTGRETNVENNSMNMWRVYFLAWRLGCAIWL
jgi:prolyl oligopeptidase